MHSPKPKPYCIVKNEPPQAFTSMSMHTKRNTNNGIQTGDISTLNSSSLKLVDKFIFLGTEKDIINWKRHRHVTAWAALNRLSVIWKLDLIDKMQRSFFQAAVVSILLHRRNKGMLNKRVEEKLDGNYTRMLRAILNKSWRQHPTKQQQCTHLPPITKTIKVWRAKHAGEAGTSS